MTLPRYFILLFLASSTASGDDLQEILYLQDQRDASGLASYLVSEDTAIRYGTAVATASVQDSTLIPQLAILLNDPSPEVRSASALALGQLTAVASDGQRAHPSDLLLNRFDVESETSVLLRLAEAIGKVGTPSALERLVTGKGTYTGEVGSEIALTVGRFAYRNIKSVAAARFAAESLRADEVHIWKAAYALMRIGVDSLLLPHLPAMKASFERGDADTRMFLASALGATGSPETVSLLTRAAGNDHDWRVRVSATRALGGIRSQDRLVMESLLGLTRDRNEHVSLTALTAIRGGGGADSLETAEILRVLPDLIKDVDSSTARQRGAAAVTMASRSRDVVATQLAEWWTAGQIPDESFVEALGHCDGQETFDTLTEFARSDNPLIARAALDALDAAVRRNPANESRRIKLRSVLASSLGSDDMAVLVVAGGGLGDSLYADSSVVPVLLDQISNLATRKETEPLITMIQSLGALRSAKSVPVLQSLLRHKDRTVALEAARALESITSRSYLQEVAPPSGPGYSDYDWEFLRNLGGAIVEVHTSVGMFAFEMLPANAPFTCMNFARLIDAGFYDGLRFHRVVPNFVIQGGDPRGDGWGGPGYSIRSEFGPERYEAGMVGVASSGKDTEGCQFFVTHSKQPHLDGRYTIFGRITEGMDVVDRIQVGDGIAGVKLVRTRNGERGTRKE